MAAQKQRKPDVNAPRSSARGPKLARPDADATPSPAAALQALLSSEIESEGRWSPLATIGFVALTCGGFWGVAAWGLTRLIR